jgi:predicted nucleic acid-binding protein
MQLIGPSERAQAAKLAQDLADWWFVIQPSGPLRRAAIQLLERYDLRAADSLQLAAALAWCEGSPQGRIFLTADERLHRAASHMGFDSKRL